MYNPSISYIQLTTVSLTLKQDKAYRASLFISAGYFYGATIVLSHNNLTRFDSAVFENILWEMIMYNGQLRLHGSTIKMNDIN
jgi:hypothetical protein